MNALVKLILLFLLAQILGFYAGWQITQDMTKNPYIEAFVVTSDSQDPMNALYFFVYILIGALVFILIMKFYFAEILFKFLELGLVATASSIVFYSLIRLWFGYEASMAIGILLGLLLGFAKFFVHKVKNLATIMAAAGAGVIFGISLGVLPVVLLLIFLSVYDYLAVFKTKHMVKMADFITKQNLSFTITAQEIIPETKKEARIDLGSGDIIAPIMFGISVLPISPLASLFVMAGATIFLFGFLFLALKKRIVLPALPPIVCGMILFLLIGKFSGFY